MARKTACLKANKVPCKQDSQYPQFNSLSCASLSTLRRWWGAGFWDWAEEKKRLFDTCTLSRCCLQRCWEETWQQKMHRNPHQRHSTDPPWLCHLINALSASTHTQVNMKLTKPGVLKFGCSLRINLLIKSLRNQSPSEINYFEAVILPAIDVLIL